MEYKDKINDYLTRLKELIDQLDTAAIDRTMQAIDAQRRRGGRVFIFGNGGSAATASHFVCDFNKGASEYLEPGFNFICLNDNIPVMTAIANDLAYDEIYVHQLRRLLKPEDMVIAVSGSGNSRNIVKAVEYARQIGSKVVGVTGYSGGRLKALSDYSLHVPADDMQKVEDLHMVFDHMMMQIFFEASREPQA